MLFKQTLALSSVIAFSAFANVDQENEESLFQAAPKKADEVAYSYVSTPAPIGTNSTPINNDYPGRGMPNTVYGAVLNPQGSVHMGVLTEFLYWDSGINQYTAFTLESVPFPSGGPATIFINRVLHNFSSHFQPGFRVGLQFAFAAQGWDLLGDWTYFHNKKHSSYSQTDLASTGTTVRPAWPNGEIATWATVDQSDSWFLNYNQAGLVIGKEIFFSKYYSLRPNMGGRYVHANSGFAITNKNPPGYPGLEFYHVTMKNDLSIFGFSFGLDNRFMLGYGFSLMGNLNAGLMYGPNQVSYQSFYNNPANNPDNPLISTNHMTARDLIPALDARLDLNWERNLNHGRQALSFTIGYEYHALISAFTTLAFPIVKNYPLDPDSLFFTELATVQHTNLFLQGMNVGLKYSF